MEVTHSLSLFFSYEAATTEMDTVAVSPSVSVRVRTVSPTPTPVMVQTSPLIDALALLATLKDVVGVPSNPNNVTVTLLPFFTVTALGFTDAVLDVSHPRI